VGERPRPLPITVRHDQNLGAEIRHVAPGKAVGERNRKNAVATLERLHPVDEAADRLARGVEKGDHPTIGHGHGRADLAAGRAQGEVDELAGALERVGVRVFLVEDEEIRGFDHALGQVAMRVELDADRHPRADPRPDRLQKIALAVLATFGDHGAVQAQEHDVDGKGRLELGEDAAAQFAPGGGTREARGGREGREALDQLVALGVRPLARGHEGTREEAGLRGMRARLEPEIVSEALEPGRDRREAVGLGADRGHEDPHARPRCHLAAAGYARPSASTSRPTHPAADGRCA